MLLTAGEASHAYHTCRNSFSCSLSAPELETCHTCHTCRSRKAVYSPLCALPFHSSRRNPFHEASLKDTVYDQYRYRTDRNACRSQVLIVLPYNSQAATLPEDYSTE